MAGLLIFKIFTEIFIKLNRCADTAINGRSFINMQPSPTVIPIAGGKGGVGKSLFTANLALALADRGKSVIAVDLDLGGSNLHLFIGLQNKYAGVGDFLRSNSKDLSKMLVDTGHENLKFLAGDGRSPFMANIPYAQKTKLIKHIQNLPAEIILVDLGAGTSYNTLDFFRMAPRGFLITTPEYPSVMNLLAFLKLFLLRAIERKFSRNHYIQELLKEIYSQPMTGPQANIPQIKALIANVSIEAGRELETMCQTYRPRIIFNMGEHPDDLLVAWNITRSMESLLAIEADFFGFIFEESAVKESVKKREILIKAASDSMAAQSIRKIAERVDRFWDTELIDSAQLLMQHTQKIFDESKTNP